MSKNIEIDNVAVWKQVAALDEGAFDVKTTAPGVKYLPRRSKVPQVSTEPMYRLVKNYKIDDGEGRSYDYSLFARTFRDDSEEVVAQLDSISEKVTFEEVEAVVSDPDMLRFDYINEFIEEKK